MKLVDTKLLLQKAYQHGYAVPAVNVDNTDTITGVFKVCEELKAPVIIQIAPIQVHPRGMTYAAILNSIKALGQEYDVTCALHLDHGNSRDDLEVAVNSGFNSVMFDGSALSFADNIRSTKTARLLADKISLEGEIGKIGGSEGESGNNGITDDCYTNVREAVEFVRQTKVDFLAVGIGNAHGTYKNEPNLNFERLAQLHEALPIPLVLHGASGLSESDLSRAVKMGIAKINFFTDVDKAFLRGITESLAAAPDSYTFKCFLDGRSYMEKTIRRIIRMCLCENKA